MRNSRLRCEPLVANNFGRYPYVYGATRKADVRRRNGKKEEGRTERWSMMVLIDRRGLLNNHRKQKETFRKYYVRHRRISHIFDRRVYPSSLRDPQHRVAVGGEVETRFIRGFAAEKPFGIATERSTRTTIPSSSFLICFPLFLRLSPVTAANFVPPFPVDPLSRIPAFSLLSSLNSLSFTLLFLLLFPFATSPSFI